MSKKHATKKQILNGYEKIIKCGYCDLQRLLSYKSATYYTTRAEGWTADVYDVDGVAIVTGYNPFGNIKPCRDIIDEYEKNAAEILYNCNDYFERIEKINALLDKFITEVLKNE